MTDIIEERLNALADQIAAEGMVLRAADVRAGAVEIARQQHEIARLRVALQEIAAYPHSEYGGEIARRALENKP